MRARVLHQSYIDILTDNCHESGWPKFPKNHFRGKFLVPFYDTTRSYSSLQPEGPFEAYTSHPVLLIGSTAVAYD